MYMNVYDTGNNGSNTQIQYAITAAVQHATVFSFYSLPPVWLGDAAQELCTMPGEY